MAGSRSPSCTGFTLIELLVAVAILAIVAMIGVPSFQSFMEKQRVMERRDALLGGLSLARETALNQLQPVVLCPSNDGSSCGSSWANGWLAFIDSDRDGALDNGEDIIAVQQQDASISVSQSGASSTVTFQPNGFVTSSTFSFCSATVSTSNRRVGISSVGNLTLGDGSAITCS
ncbi:GspH/FimT family pseudopilin [Pseudaeromonas paramecii]|uniref:Type II secretion system protein H n=2 Tax=Pseudaeromonas paramecii TaxID=2138166 RepID=A0ABP8Q8U0_9GAMM